MRTDSNKVTDRYGASDKGRRCYLATLAVGKGIRPARVVAIGDAVCECVHVLTARSDAQWRQTQHVVQDGLPRVGARLVRASFVMANRGGVQTPAGCGQRVSVFDMLFPLGFGPRLPQAARLLAEGLYLE